MNNAFIKQFNRLEQEKKALLDSLQGLSDDVLNRKPSNGGWSAIQIVHHLNKVEGGSALYLAKKLPHAQEAAEAGIKAYFRYLLVVFFLKATFIKRKAPVGTGSDLPESDTLAAATAQWDKTRIFLHDQLATVAEENAHKELYKHPLVGRISLSQMLGFMAEHVKRHRGQIKRTLANIQ